MRSFPQTRPKEAKPGDRIINKVESFRVDRPRDWFSGPKCLGSSGGNWSAWDISWRSTRGGNRAELWPRIDTRWRREGRLAENKMNWKRLNGCTKERLPSNPCHSRDICWERQTKSSKPWNLQEIIICKIENFDPPISRNCKDDVQIAMPFWEWFTGHLFIHTKEKCWFNLKLTNI